MGEGFINYPKVKDETKKIIADYIGVMNATLNSAGIITTTHTSVLKMAENPHKDKGVAKFTDKSVANMDTISTFIRTVCNKEGRKYFRLQHYEETCR